MAISCVCIRVGGVYHSERDCGPYHMSLLFELNSDIIWSVYWLYTPLPPILSLYINSPGGSVSSGMAIYDTMQVGISRKVLLFF